MPRRKREELLGRIIPRHVVFRDVQKLTSFSEDITAAGMQPDGRVLRSGVSHDRRIATLMGQKVLWRLERLRSADGFPICIELTYLPATDRKLAERVTGSLYRVLEENDRIPVRSQELIRFRAATAREANLLRLRRAQPVIEICRLAFNRRGDVQEFTKNVLRADRYMFRLELARE